MTSNSKNLFTVFIYVSMTIATDPINTIQFTNYTIHIDTNPSNRLWRQCFQQNNGLDGSASLFTPNRIQSAQNPNTNYHPNTNFEILTPSSAIIYCYDAIYIPSLQGAALLCWLWLPLRDYCVLAILRRFRALRSLYLKHLNCFRVQLILMFY